MHVETGNDRGRDQVVKFDEEKEKEELVRQIAVPVSDLSGFAGRGGCQTYEIRPPRTQHRAGETVLDNKRL